MTPTETQRPDGEQPARRDIDWSPEEAALFRNRYAIWGRNWSLAGLAMVIVAVVLATGRHVLVGVLLGSIGGTVALILGFAFWLTGRGAGRQLEGIRQGGYLARWRIDHDRWWAWHRDRAQKIQRVVLALVAMVALVGFGVAGMIYSDGDDAVATWIAVGTLAAMPTTALICRLHRAPEPSPSLRSMPLVIGPSGALTIGHHLQWRGFGMAFVGAEVHDHPPTLSVRFEVSTRHSTVEHTLDLPVPLDGLAEAKQVAAALNGAD